MCVIKQGNRPVVEYIWEFQRIIGKLSHWLEQLLAYHFRNGLSWVLHHTCLSRGIPDQVCDWYRMTMVVELDIRGYQAQGGVESWSKQSPGQCLPGMRWLVASVTKPLRSLSDMKQVHGSIVARKDIG